MFGIGIILFSISIQEAVFSAEENRTWENGFIHISHRDIDVEKSAHDADLYLARGDCAIVGINSYSIYFPGVIVDEEVIYKKKVVVILVDDTVSYPRSDDEVKINQNATAYAEIFNKKMSHECKFY